MKINLVFATLGFCLLSCEKKLIPDNPPNTPENNFEVFWKTFDERYSFFEVKNIDWDSVNAVYRPKLYPHMHDTDLFNIYKELILLLRDGHITLASTVSPTIFYNWYSSAPANFDLELLTKQYLRKDFRREGPIIYKLFGHVGYLYYGSLSDKLKDENMEEILRYFSESKGIIIDVRDNAGGEVLNAEKLASYFNEHSRLAGYWLFKKGPGRNDFTAPVPYYIKGQKEKAYLKPVVLLTNRKVFSATNDLAMMFKALPNAVLLGDTTGGGGGIPMHSELPNGWILGLPTTQTLDVSNVNVEPGIPPDIYVTMTKDDIKNGIDPLIEAAIDYLK